MFKGSLHKKKNRYIYWSFTNKGGGGPPDQYISVFSLRKLVLLKNYLYSEEHLISKYFFFNFDPPLGLVAVEKNAQKDIVSNSDDQLPPIQNSQLMKISISWIL